MTFKTIVLCLIFLFSCLTSQASILHVKTSGSDSYSGAVWESAKKSVQAAVDAASSGDEVWVAAGTYPENILLKEGVAVYGGFAGNESQREQRNCGNNPTILDATKHGRVVTFPFNTTNACRLDGFTITNGYYTGYGGGIYCSDGSPIIANNRIISNISGNPSSYYAGGAGGGLYFKNSSAILINNLVSRNTSYVGDGIYCDTAPITLINNTLISNNGTAITCNNSAVKIQNSIIAFNFTGISANSGAGVQLNNNCVYGNTNYNYASTLTHTTDLNQNPLFMDRRQEDYHLSPDSPCIDAGDPTLIDASLPDLDGKLRTGNPDIGIYEVQTTAPVSQIWYVKPVGYSKDGHTWETAFDSIQTAIEAARYGDEIRVAAGTYAEALDVPEGIALYGGFAGTESTRYQRNVLKNPTILDGTKKYRPVTFLWASSNNRIDGFTITNGQFNGYGGGIFCTNGSPVIANNRILSNISGNPSSYYSGGAGGGIYFKNSSAILINNLISKNNSYMGEGIYCDTAPITLINNTLTNNNGTAIACNSSAVKIQNSIIAFNFTGISANSGAGVQLNNNCVFGNTNYDYASSLTHASDLNQNPLFIDRPQSDYHLSPDSPCINAGDPTLIDASIPDLDNQLRTGNPDIGAFEAQGTAPIPQVWLVKPGTLAHDGITWETAFSSVQAAIDAARYGDEIWVAAGTYAENLNLPEEIALYGGFAGTESARDQRNTAINPTILDGTKKGRVITLQWASANNRIDGFTITNGQYNGYGGGIFCTNGSPVIANNRILSNISGNPSSYYSGGAGGGIYFKNSSAILINNLISKNNSYMGEGIYCDNSPVTITNNTFVNNYGTAITCNNSAVKIQNSIIAFNSSGISANSGTGIQLKNNCVYGNTSFDYPSSVSHAGDLNQNPLFTARIQGDYHLSPDSPCINAGDPTLIDTSLPDLDGKLRTGNPDIGAFETQGAAPISQVWLVKPGTLAHDGITWETAFSSVQAAIDVARYGDEIWVAAGTYAENLNLPEGIALYGGFAGTESSRDQRNTAINPTILDGTKKGRVITLQWASANNRIDGFTITNGQYNGYGGGIFCTNGSPTIINNRILSNISGNPANSYSGGSGGGLYFKNSSAILINNLISKNNSYAGEGIYCDTAPITLTNNTLVNNYGMAVECHASAAIIQNSIIAFNYRGIYADSSSPLQLKNNCVYGSSGSDYIGSFTHASDLNQNPLFVDRLQEDYHLTPGSPCIDQGDRTVFGAPMSDLDCQPRTGSAPDIGALECQGVALPASIWYVKQGAASGGGASWETAFSSIQAGVNAARYGDQVWVAAGTYVENITLPEGIALYGGFAGTESDLTHRNIAANPTVIDGSKKARVINIPWADSKNRVDGFTLTNGWDNYAGGGICCANGSPVIANNRIIANTSGNTSNYYSGGTGGGLYFKNSSVVVINNLISKNISYSGGGLYCDNAPISLVNNTLIGNSGSAIDCQSSLVSIGNSIVAFNDYGIKAKSGTAVALKNNCVYGNSIYDYSGVAKGADDLKVDPLLVNASQNDAHLTATSPCIDNGDAGLIQAGWIDLDSEPRVANAGVDIGADEFAGVPDPGIPDLQLRSLSQTEFIGGGIYQTIPGSEQTLNLRVPDQAAALYEVKLENDGAMDRTFVLYAKPDSSTGWSTKITLDTTDITSKLTGDGYLTVLLAPGSSQLLTVQMTPDKTVIGETSYGVTLEVRLYQGDKLVRDSIRATATLIARRRPDLQIAAGNGTYNGVGIYNDDASSQTASLSVENSSTASYRLNIANNGNMRDAFTLKATAGDSNWTVKYLDAASSADVTSQITGTGLLIDPLNPTAYHEFRIQVTPAAKTLGRSVKEISISVSLPGISSERDTVKSSTTVLPNSRPDLQIRGVRDSSYVGDNLYNTTGIKQSKGLLTQLASAAVSIFKLENDGNLIENPLITAPVAAAGWTARFYDSASGGNEVSSSVNGTGWTPGNLMPGESKEFRLELTPDLSVSPNSICPVLVTATSQQEGSAADSSKLIVLGGTDQGEFWVDHKVLGPNGDALHPFAGVYEYENLVIGDGVEVTSTGLSQLVIKVKGTLSIGQNAVIRVRNGYYASAPGNLISELTPDVLVAEGELVNGVRLFSNLYGRGGDGGNGGAGGFMQAIRHYAYGGYYWMAGNGGNGGHGGGGGFGGGHGGIGGHGSYGMDAPDGSSRGIDGRSGVEGADNGGSNGITSGGGATGIGANGTYYATMAVGGYGGGGNGGCGASGGPNNFNLGFAGGGGGGGGGGYGGGILTIQANQIQSFSDTQPEFLVSGQIGGTGGPGGALADSGDSGLSGQGGLLIIDCPSYTASTAHWKLASSNKPVTSASSNGGHGTIIGSPQKVFINSVDDTSTLTGLVLSGPDTVTAGKPVQFTANASWNSGQTVSIWPQWSISSSLGSMSTDGILTANPVTQPTQFTLSASYSFCGVSQIETKLITVIPAASSYTSPAGFVHTGWNLISVPAVPVNADPAVVFQGFDLSIVSLQYWLNTDGGGWQSYGTSFNWTGPILQGIPYWFLTPSPTMIKPVTFSGSALSTDFNLTIPAHKNAPFWVMLASPFDQEIACENVRFTNSSISLDSKSWVDAVAAKWVESKALGFDNGAQQFFTAGPGGYSSDRLVLQPWYGYWLLIDRPEQLTITLPAP